MSVWSWIVSKFKKTETQHLSSLSDKVLRPWGEFRVFYKGPNACVKEILVLPGGQLSLQSHEFRDEVWAILEGTGIVIVDEKEYKISSQQIVYVPRKSKHRITNTSSRDPLLICEMQVGDKISEDDITRYADIYGRANPGQSAS